MGPRASDDILGDKNISPARKFRMMRQQQAEKLIQQDDIKSKLAQAAAGLLKQSKTEMEEQVKTRQKAVVDKKEYEFSSDEEGGDGGSRDRDDDESDFEESDDEEGDGEDEDTPEESEEDSDEESKSMVAKEKEDDAISFNSKLYKQFDV